MSTFSALVLVCSVMVVPVVSQTAAHQDSAAVTDLAYPLADARQELRADLSHAELGSMQAIPNDDLQAKPKQRSVGRAALYSALVPGAGQFYNHSYWEGLAFLAIEVSAWTVYATHQNRGDEMTNEFESFANLHWFEPEYWRSLSDDALHEQGLVIDPDDIEGLREYERQSFSHYLPESKNQTYYENIGKYDQFNAGWDDSISGQARERDSANREAYTIMRREANDQYKTATTGLTVALFNHVLSALHAAYVTNRSNTRVATEMGMKMKRYNRELVPTLSMSVAW